MRVLFRHHSLFDLEVDGREINLSPIESTIMNCLMRHKGYVRTNDLIDVAYGHDPDGGPLTANVCIRVIICKLRKKLRETDLRIIGRNTAGYKLVLPVEPNAAI